MAERILEDQMIIDECVLYLVLLLYICDRLWENRTFREKIEIEV